MNDDIKFFGAIDLILADPDLSSRAKLLWIYLVKSAWKTGQTFFGTTIGKNVSMGPKKLYRAQAELIDSGLIHIEKRSRGQASVIKPLSGLKTLKAKSIAKMTIVLKDRKKSDKIQDNKQIHQKHSQNDHASKKHQDETKRTKMSELMDKNVLLSGQICPQTSQENQSQSSFPDTVKESIRESIKVPTFVGIVSATSVSNESNSVIKFPNPNQTKKEPKPKISKHQASREEQLNQIKSNLDEYRVQYPDININLEMEGFEYWLNNYPKGKMRKDLFLTWKNWLHREHVQQKKRKNTLSNKPKREFDLEEYNRYVADNNI